ncbi:multidomain vesicle coat component Sec16 [Schizosaccharomyces cryophilus OY26]|uniref:Protein transport protein sec16 n=1 Tax=Schizosaccharomyces cryophilus (strain OY26 / ATCC MYA-4695 / CBS 11777 / NBRC 106824 / NRRL Y48691) TaxID=653667 RepID=S9VZP8_SCHCR|nr:multidomain vesicle coat component Sec16 [Schizosaccharomyces cryophilus OY26]EPY53143.1 multidomain vesicle coat component Sec16 [Schizosaccharomyces cryophilus OY26]
MDVELTSKDREELPPSAVEKDSSNELISSSSPQQLEESNIPVHPTAEEDEKDGSSELDQPNSFAASTVKDIEENPSIHDQKNVVTGPAESVSSQDPIDALAQNDEQIGFPESESMHEQVDSQDKGETASFDPSLRDVLGSQELADEPKEAEEDSSPNPESKDTESQSLEANADTVQEETSEPVNKGIASAAENRFSMSQLFANDEPSSLGLFDNLIESTDSQSVADANSSDSLFGQVNQKSETKTQDLIDYNNPNESQFSSTKETLEAEYDHPVSASTETVLSSSSKHLEMEYRNQESIVPKNQPFRESGFDKETTHVFTDDIQPSSTENTREQPFESISGAVDETKQENPTLHDNSYEEPKMVTSNPTVEETTDLFQNNPEEEEKFFYEVLQPHEQTPSKQPKNRDAAPSLETFSSFNQPTADEDTILFNQFANNDTSLGNLSEEKKIDDTNYNELIDDSEFSSLMNNFLKPAAQPSSSAYIPKQTKPLPAASLSPLETIRRPTSQNYKPFVASKEGYSSPYDLPEEIVQQAQQKRSASYTSARKAAQISASKTSSSTVDNVQGFNAPPLSSETLAPPTITRQPPNILPVPPDIKDRPATVSAHPFVNQTARASDGPYGSGRYTSDLSSIKPSTAPMASLQGIKTFETKPPTSQKNMRSSYAPIISPNESPHVQQLPRASVSYTPIEPKKPMASIPNTPPFGTQRKQTQTSVLDGSGVRYDPPTGFQTKAGYSPSSTLGRAYPSVPNLQSPMLPSEGVSSFVNGNEIQSIRGSTAPPLPLTKVSSYTATHDTSINTTIPSLNRGYNAEHIFPSDTPGTTLPPIQRPVSRTRSPVLFHTETIPDRPATVSLPAKPPHESESMNFLDVQQDNRLTGNANPLSIETRVGNDYLSAHSAHPYSKPSPYPLELRSPIAASVPVSPNIAASKSESNLVSSNEMLQQQIDLVRSKPKPIITFGPCGTVITSFPISSQLYSANGRRDSYQPGLLKLQSLTDLLPQDYDHVSNFPGPFIGSGDKLDKNAKSAAKEWISKYIENLNLEMTYSSPGDTSQSEDKLLLLQSMELLLSIPDMSTFPENLVKILVSGFEKPPPCNTATTVQELINPERNVDSSPVVSTRDTTVSFLERVYDYLLIGDKEEALNFALQEKQWSFALIISFALGPKVLESTVRSFTKSEVKTEMLRSGVGINLQLALQLLSGVDATSMSEFSSTSSLLNLSMQSRTTNALASWKELVANIICNQYKDKNNALIELGKLLLQENRIYAAHMVFMFTFSPEICSQHSQSLFHLVGLPKDGTLPTHDELLDSVQLTEVLALIYSLHTERGVVTYPHLMNYRLYLATTLSEIGQMQTAKKYCELIGTYLNKASKKQSNLDPDFIFAVRDLTQQIFENNANDDVTTSWLGRTVSRPRLDNVLSSLGSKFSKFVAGENDYEISRPATANNGPFGKVAAHQEATSRTGSSMGNGSKYDNRPISSGVPNPTDTGINYGVSQGNAPYMNRFDPAGLSSEPAYVPTPAFQGYQDNLSNFNLATDSQMSSPRQMQAQVGYKQPTIYGDASSRAQYAPPTSSSTTQNVWLPRTSVEEGYDTGMEGEPLESPYRYKAPVPEIPTAPVKPQYAPSQYAPIGQTHEASQYAPLNTSAYVPKVPEAENEKHPMEALTTSMQDLSFDSGRSEQAKRAAAQNVAELVKREEEEKAREKAAASERKGNRKGWFSKLLRRDDNKEQASVYQAKLGERSHLRYDKDLRRWVNEDGSELNNQVAPPPPPPKVNPTKLMNNPPPSMPIPMKVTDEISPPNNPNPTVIGASANPPVSTGLPPTRGPSNSPGLPSVAPIPPTTRAAPGARAANVDPLEDILHSVPPPATGRRGKGKTSKRYVDIMKDT